MRSSADWGDKLGYTHDEIRAANRDAIRLMLDLRARHATANTPIVVSGCVGPRGDGYDPGQVMTAEEAEAYHAHQIGALAEADMVTAITMTNANEAAGLTRAAAKAGMPAAIAFTLETDGRLPTGQSLADAIKEVDTATAGGPVYYMINCAHPTHFGHVLSAQEGWTTRIRGIRANASRRSHQELNDAPDLDAGDPIELGGQYRDLLRQHPQINVLGAAAARITGTSSASVLRAALPPDRRAHKLAPSQLEGILKSAGLCKVRRALATPFNLIIEAKRQSQV